VEGSTVIVKMILSGIHLILLDQTSTASELSCCPRPGVSCPRLDLNRQWIPQLPETECRLFSEVLTRTSMSSELLSCPRPGVSSPSGSLLEPNRCPQKFTVLNPVRLIWFPRVSITQPPGDAYPWYLKVWSCETTQILADYVYNSVLQKSVPCEHLCYANIQ